MKFGSSRILALVPAFLALFLCFPAAGKDIGTALDEAILQQTSALVPGSLKLPTAPGENLPPPIVQAAGKEFIRAWQTYDAIRALQLASRQAVKPKAEADLINAATEHEKFADLLQRCIRAEPPPEPSEFSRFTYDDQSTCGSGPMTFLDTSEKASTLLLLRRGQYLEALPQLSRTTGPARDALLRAFGVDPEEFRIGK
ncbi:MAG: hypothetical protein V4584_17105 [Verrucomicrobiota bacterium]